MSADYSIHELCAALDVSRSGDHAWVRRTPGPRAQANAQLLDLILQTHAQSRQTYGSPRVTRCCASGDHACGRHRLARLMRRAGLRQRPRPRFRISLTDKRPRICPSPPIASWASRRGIGWAMDDTLAHQPPVTALNMALTQRRPPQGLVHHSDRGVQYASAAYRQPFGGADVRPGMSRCGNCYDNAAMEKLLDQPQARVDYRHNFQIWA